MRVLALVTDAFGGRGGIAKFNRDLLTVLCSYPKCEEVVAIPRLMPDPAGDLPVKLKCVNKGLNCKVKFVWNVFKAAVRGPRFDIIVCGHIHILPLAFGVRLLTRAPVVLVIHGVDAWRPVKRFFIRRLIKQTQYFISVSEVTKNRFVKWSGLAPDKGFLLPNCVDTASLAPGPPSEELIRHYGLQEKKVIMTLGRLAGVDRYKGFDEILEVMPDLLKQVPQLVYLITGDGNDKERLRRKARTLGVEQNVIFTGYVNEADKPDYYRLADVFAMPGKGEGFGIVYLEAMACGIPVIASTADGSREAVRNGKLGLLVDPDDKDQLTRSILQALSLPKGQVPEGLEYFSAKNFEKRLHLTLDKILL